MQEEVPEPRFAAGGTAVTGALQEAPVKREKEKKQKKEKKVGLCTLRLPPGCMHLIGAAILTAAVSQTFGMYCTNRRARRRRPRRRRNGRLMQRQSQRRQKNQGPGCTVTGKQVR
jgi:hypothetical protein